MPPWYTQDRQKLFQRLRYAPLRIPATMSRECAACVAALLQRDPRLRLGSSGASGVKNHVFFSSVDWGGLPDLKPPLEPCRGVEDTGATNFDKQFTRLALVTDVDGEGQTLDMPPVFENFTFDESPLDAADDDAAAAADAATAAAAVATDAAASDAPTAAPDDVELVVGEAGDGR